MTDIPFQPSFDTPRPASVANAASPVVTRREARARQTLRQFVVFAMVLPLTALFFRDSALDDATRWLAGATWVLCLLPAWDYLRFPPRRRPPIPFLPMIGIAYGVYFVLQAVLGDTNVYGRFNVAAYMQILDPHLYRQAVQLVFAGWVMLLGGYWVVSRVIRIRPRIAEQNLVALRGLALGVVGVGVAMEIAKRLPIFPSMLRGSLYSSALLALLGVALLIVLRVRRCLTPLYTAVLYGTLALLFFLGVGTAAGQIFVLLLTCVLAVWIGGGHIPGRWVFIGVVGASFMVALRGTAGEQRQIIRRAGIRLSASQNAVMLLDMLHARTERDGVVEVVVSGFQATAQRSALLDLFTDVIRQTPEAVPYWGGETYKSLVGAFVPRFLWPGKPTKTVGYQFGHRYHYLPEDYYNTTINMPFLVEFYANFGVVGVLLGMLLVGAIYRALEAIVNVPGQSIIASICGLGLLVPLLNLESDFSLVFGGLFLNGMLFYGVYLAGIRVSRRRARTAASELLRAAVPAR